MRIGTVVAAAVMLSGSAAGYCDPVPVAVVITTTPTTGTTESGGTGDPGTGGSGTGTVTSLCSSVSVVNGVTVTLPSQYGGSCTDPTVTGSGSGGDVPIVITTMPIDGGEGTETTGTVVVGGGTAGTGGTDGSTASAVTPEPSSMVLLTTGLLGAAGVIRRRLS